MKKECALTLDLFFISSLTLSHRSRVPFLLCLCSAAAPPSPHALRGPLAVSLAPTLIGPSAGSPARAVRPGLACSRYTCARTSSSHMQPHFLSLIVRAPSFLALLALQVPSDTCSTPRDVKALLGSPPYTIGGSNAVLDFTSACPPPPPPPPPAATGGDDGDGDAAQRLDRLGGGGGAGAIVGVIVGLLVVGGLGAGGYVAYKKGYFAKKVAPTQSV